MHREAILLILFLFILVFLVPLLPSGIVDEKDAVSFVYEDLSNRYPQSEISIISVEEKVNDGGETYYSIKAKVVHNPKSPCPERVHIYYNYPEQRFIPSPPDVITKDCSVCQEGICTLAFLEEAIIASHTMDGTESVRSFIESNNAYPLVSEKDGWIVRWVGENSTLIVSLSKSGNVRSIVLQK